MHQSSKPPPPNPQAEYDFWPTMLSREQSGYHRERDRDRKTERDTERDTTERQTDKERERSVTMQIPYRCIVLGRREIV